MTVFELIDRLESIAYSDNCTDPEVYIQIGDWQTPIKGITYFPETKGICWESVVIGDKKKPKLIL